MTQTSADNRHKWDETLSVVATWRKGLNTAALANLRRCTTIDDVYLNSDFHRLKHRLPNDGPIRWQGNPMLPVLTALTAHLSVEPSSSIGTEDATTWLGKQLGPPPGDGSPKLHEIRFKRLLAESDIEALLPMLRRIVRLLRGDIPLEALWRGIPGWNSHTRRNFARGYYANL